MRWLRWLRRGRRQGAGVVLPPPRVVFPPAADTTARVVLGFRDGSTVDVPDSSARATELRHLADALIGKFKHSA
jgi:hypothetical protein